ncbi:Stk1 family PASTA domain-containing Ser/Thr kinase [Bombilactobacillus bombi]|uniref:Stk1 family PASTA domain-containing Ser/Thr kinase n=1 Tax=Bombilactobacillus bombi TaxID=1303590 RepID=UPI000E5916A2|nr:Stk1 family PASTA domain-containing Ser/Thr kinase [Bombilactobacillus bombi]AXX64343.1 Stk1 family PASTA domain-containing Ser/Thr kinase [Bombilactobacillus bombi]
MINKGDLIANRYLIVDTLGEGGMSNVYLAEDTYLHRKVALKSLRADLQNDEQIRLRFQRESRAMSKLSSPYIVNILDVGDEDIPFIVMEYVPGGSLKKYIKHHFPIPYPQVIKLMEEILQGVAVAHQHGIIHRDLKPQNVMITPEQHAKVADFGIALSQGEQSITQTNSTMGSVHYMAPERVRGQQASVQSDIYALGIILYEMLTNHLPFDGETSLAIALKHFNEATPSLRQAQPDIPQALENVVFRATAKDPSVRYTSALAMATDLKTVLSPQRAHEPVFVPSNDEKERNDSEETKVLPELVDDDNKKDVPPIKKKNSNKKFWWLMAALLVILFLIGWGWLNARQEVAVPDVTNLNATQARAVLNNSQLKSRVSASEHSNRVAKNDIIRSVPPKGTHVKSGTTIKLVRSLGPVLRTVPNVVGQNYYEARNQLTSLGFRVKRINRYSQTVPAGNVIKQTPRAKSRIASKKKAVRLTVSLGQKNYSFAVKDLTGYNLRGAQDYANEEGLQLVVKTVPSSTVEKGNVVSQNPIAGTRILRGASLVVNISSGKPDNSDQHNNSDANTNPTGTSPQTVTRTINLPFNGQDNQSKNTFQIYIKDANHNLNDLYKETEIDSTTQITIPFQLNKGQTGQYKVVRDGIVLDSENVTAG